jgi:glutamate:GABA antiporter
VTPPTRPAAPAPQLRRALGFRDLFLFYLVTGFSRRWVATAAAAGPSALVIWIIAALGLFVPLSSSPASVLAVSEEGGIYVWSKRALTSFRIGGAARI